MICFVAGIDTAIGKTVATGLLARAMLAGGRRVITQKIVQTGSGFPAEDIVKHREMMGITLTDEDRSGLTCPYVFQYPASPHLAARMEGQVIDCGRITAGTAALAGIYDDVVIEGAGGLHVPLNESTTVLEYLAVRKYPVLLVSSSRLGSINHTLMSLELLASRGITLLGLVYNRYREADPEIGEDSKLVFGRHLARMGCPVPIIEIGLEAPRVPAANPFSAII